jgi:hypothetical protein
MFDKIAKKYVHKSLISCKCQSESETEFKCLLYFSLKLQISSS